LILTGNLEPTQQVRERADLENVAIVLSSFDTLETIEKMETIFERSRFTQIDKIRRFEKLLSQEMDFEQFYHEIGLS
jgi:BioD-like phosphotransacetylase family protein